MNQQLLNEYRQKVILPGESGYEKFREARRYHRQAAVIPFNYNEINFRFQPYQVGLKIRRVLLVLVGHKTEDFIFVTPPLGIMYLSSFIKKQRPGCEVKIHDMKLNNTSYDEVARLAKEFGADLVGLSAISPNAYHLPGLVDSLKKQVPAVPVVLGGAFASSEEERVFYRAPFDFSINGEGEFAFERLMTILEKPRPGLRSPFDYQSVEQDPLFESLSSTRGLSFVSAGNLVKHGYAAKIEELDGLPFPDWRAVDIDAYEKNYTMTPIYKRRYMAVFTSRGCPFKCNYCHDHFGKSFRSRSPVNVVDELEMLVEQYGIRYFEIVDDIFNYDKKRVIAVCNEITRRNLDIYITFPNGLRGDFLNEEVIDALKEAGTIFISFAIETGSKRLQRKIAKHINFERILKNINYAAEQRIFCNGFFMLGFPDETEEEINKTIDLATYSRLHTASFFIVTPYEGTSLFESLGENQKQYDSTAHDYNSRANNCTGLGSEKLNQLYKKAYRKFYYRPGRLWRIARDLPHSYKVVAHFLPVMLGRTFQLK